MGGYLGHNNLDEESAIDHDQRSQSNYSGRTISK